MMNSRGIAFVQLGNLEPEMRKRLEEQDCNMEKLKADFVPPTYQNEKQIYMALDRALVRTLGPQFEMTTLGSIFTICLNLITPKKPKGVGSKSKNDDGANYFDSISKDIATVVKLATRLESEFNRDEFKIWIRPNGHSAVTDLFNAAIEVEVVVRDYVELARTNSNVGRAIGVLHHRFGKTMTKEILFAVEEDLKSSGLNIQRDRSKIWKAYEDSLRRPKRSASRP